MIGHPVVGMNSCREVPDDFGGNLTHSWLAALPSTRRTSIANISEGYELIRRGGDESEDVASIGRILGFGHYFTS